MEVAAGDRFEAALALVAAVPGAQVWVTDVHPKVLRAPPPLVARVDDLWAPDLSLYRGAALVYGLRIPEELQGAAARVARTVGAPFAHLPLKDEYADLSDVFPRPPRVLSGGWRLHR